MKCNLISENHRRYLLVFGAFLIHFSLGSFYNFGNIQQNIVNYMQNYSYSKNIVNLDNTHWIYGTMVFGLGTTFSLGGFIEQKIGSSLTVLIGGLIFSFNVCLMMITLKTYLSVVIISYGLISGFGMGLAYGVALAVPIKWFPNHKGLIFGIAVSGFGISATVFDALQIYILDSGRVNDLQNLPKSFLILGLIFACLQIIGSILIANGPQENETNTTDISSETEDGQCTVFQNSTNHDQIDFEPHQILLELDFWILWIILFLTSFWIYFITQVYSRYWTYLTTDGDFNIHLLYVSIIASVFNCCGRIFWGFIIDKKSFKMVMLINIIPSAIFIGTFPIFSLQNNHSINYIFGLWVIIIYFLFSGIFSIFPAICAKLFGIKNFVKNYGMLFTSCSMSGFVVSIVIMTVVPNNIDTHSLKTLNYLFFAGCVMLILAAFITIIFRGKSLIVRSTQFSMIL